MKKTFITFVSIFFTANSLFAQLGKIVTSGKIEFEKKINLYAIAKQELVAKPSEIDIELYDQYKKKSPQFGFLYSTLIFNNDKTLFTPLEPTTPLLNFKGNPMAKQFNTIYTDLATSSNISQKQIYDEIFLVKDSTRKMVWHLTDETQEVAGYTCRRANGLILDSVYVVAFYTDKIWAAGGPESFAGLPGMILKLAIPHENVSWTATKVTIEDIAPAAITPPNPKKAKIVDNKQLHALMKEYMKRWGPVGPYEMKVFLL